MSKPKHLFVVALTMLLCVPSGAQSPVAQSDKNSWARYEFDDGLISITSPAKLTLVEAPITGNGPVAKTFSATAAVEGAFFNFLYSILKIDSDAWTPAQKETFYVNVWEGLAAGYEQQIKQNKLPWTIKLVEMKAFNISGLTGRQIGYNLGPFKGTVKVLLKGNRSYVIVLTSLPETHDALARSFFDSVIIKSSVR